MQHFTPNDNSTLINRWYYDIEYWIKTLAWEAFPSVVGATLGIRKYTHMLSFLAMRQIISLLVDNCLQEAMASYDVQRREKTSVSVGRPTWMKCLFDPPIRCPQDKGMEVKIYDVQ